MRRLLANRKQLSEEKVLLDPMQYLNYSLYTWSTVVINNMKKYNMMPTVRPRGFVNAATEDKMYKCNT